MKPVAACAWVVAVVCACTKHEEQHPLPHLERLGNPYAACRRRRAADDGAEGLREHALLLARSDHIFAIDQVDSPPAVDRSETAMPDMGVNDRDGRDIAAYLYTLK